jgi:hypothetical protein
MLMTWRTVSTQPCMWALLRVENEVLLTTGAGDVVPDYSPALGNAWDAMGRAWDISLATSSTRIFQPRCVCLS